MAPKRRDSNKGKAIVEPHRKKKPKQAAPPIHYMQGSLHIRDGDDEDMGNRSTSATVSDKRRGLVDSSESSESSDSSDDDRASLFIAHRSSDPSGPSSNNGSVGGIVTGSVGGIVTGSVGGNTESVGGDGTSTPTPRRRRGEARAHSPSRCNLGKKVISFVGDALLGDSQMAGFFRPQMRNELDGFYPTWSNVPVENKNRIWELFLKEWSLGDHDHNMVYNKFMAQNGVKYRKFLSELKLSQMRLHRVKDVLELIEKPKPAFMKSSKIWKKYVRHWSSPEYRNRSAINVQNKKKSKGSHGYGRKSAAARYQEMELEGKKPSMCAVMMNVNQKRDEKNNPTGEVHHLDLHGALEKYCQKVIEVRGPDINPQEEELDIHIWKSIDEVARRMPQGRMLGVGTCKQAAAIFQPTLNVHFGPNAEMQARLNRLEEERDQNIQDNKLLKDQLAAIVAAMKIYMPGFTIPPVEQVPPSTTFSPAEQNTSSDVVAQTQQSHSTQKEPAQESPQS